MTRLAPATKTAPAKSPEPKRPWAAPRLTRLEPGSPEHDRAVAAFAAAGLIQN